MYNSRGKKSLYEAIREAQAKSAQDKALQPLHPQAAQPAPKPVVQPAVVPETPKPVAPWPAKPRIVQFNAGRIEFSLPYQLVIALLLCAVAIMLIIFRLGQHWPLQKSAKSATVKQSVTTASQTTSQPAKSPVVITENTSSLKNSKGANRIVIQTVQNSEDLAPVKKFFSQNGIETEIRKIGSWFYLITAEKYDNPEKSGTDGFAAKQRIIELGTKYQSPPGYGTFGTKPFSDAYGMRLD
jgi:hypothetical protein